MPARDDAEKQLIAKAFKDPKFREGLLKDPRSVISKELGVEIPKDISINILEETADRVYLVLPAASAEIGDLDLSETELEAVVGGAAKPPPTTAPVPGPTCPCYGTKQQTLSKTVC